MYLCNQWSIHENIVHHSHSHIQFYIQLYIYPSMTHSIHLHNLRCSNLCTVCSKLLNKWYYKNPHSLFHIALDKILHTFLGTPLHNLLYNHLCSNSYRCFYIHICKFHYNLLMALSNRFG